MTNVRYLRVLAVFIVFLVISPSAEASTESSAFSFDNKLWVNPVLGLSLLESSLNNGQFGAGFAFGFQVEYDIARIKANTLGCGFSFIAMSNTVSKGTDQISMETRYRRAGITANYRYGLPNFYWGLKAGLGLTIIGNEVQFLMDDQLQRSKTVGVDPGFLAGLSIGTEVGKRFMKLKKGIRVGGEFEWNRRGRRDEMAILMVMAFQFLGE